MSPRRSVVDPRIADRRQEVLRERRRRLYRRLGLIGAVVLVVVGAVGLTRSPLLDVDRIQVEGATHTGSAAVRQVLGDTVGTPMVEVDRGALAASVAELPWVDTVEVHRRWPGTLEVVLTERTAVAVVPRGQDRWQLVDATGRVLTEGTGPIDDRLVVLEGAEPASGPGEQVDGAEQLLAVALAVTPEVERVITGIRFGRDGDLVLSVDPIGVVRLGGTERLDEKMLVVAAVLERVDDRCLSRLDVRIPTAPTITRVPDCARGGSDDEQVEVPEGLPAAPPPEALPADGPVAEGVGLDAGGVAGGADTTWVTEVPAVDAWSDPAQDVAVAGGG